MARFVLAMLALLTVSSLQTQGEEEPAKRSPNGLPPGAIARLGEATLDVPGDVAAVAFSHDGRQFAAVSSDLLSRHRKTQIQIWDTQSGELFHRISTSRTSGSLLFSHDGGKLRCGGKTWDLDSKQELPNNLPSDIIAVARNGQRIAARNRDRVEIVIWDAMQKGTVARIRPPEFNKVALSPNGRLLAVCGSGGFVHVYDTSSGKLLADFSTGLSLSVRTLDFSPDGKLLAVGGSLKKISVIDVESARVRRTFRMEVNQRDANVLRFSPDGKHVVAASQDRGVVVRFWNVATGNLDKKLQTKLGDVNTLALSPDSQHLVLGGETSGGCGLSVWNLAEDCELFVPRGPRSRISRIAYLGEGSQLVTASDRGQLHLWDLKTGNPVHAFEHSSAQGLAATNDGWALAAMGHYGDWTIWEAATGEQLVRFPAEVFREARASVGAFSLAANLVAHGTRDGRIAVLDMLTGRSLRQFNAYDNKEVDVLALSPDGTFVASAADKNGGGDSKQVSIDLWETATGKQRTTLTSSAESGGLRPVEVRHVLFSPDGKKVAAKDDSGTTHVWDLQKGRTITQIKDSRRGVSCFSPDGDSFAYAVNNEFVLLDLASGIERLRRTAAADSEGFRSFEPSITALAISPDGKTAATALRETNTVIIWSLAPNKK